MFERRPDGDGVKSLRLSLKGLTSRIFRVRGEIWFRVTERRWLVACVVMDVLDALVEDRTGLQALAELTLQHPDAATTTFNVSDYRVLEAQILEYGQRRIHVENNVESGCPGYGIFATRRQSRRWQPVWEVRVADSGEAFWFKRRYFCNE